jgi:hypothetical protein
MEKINCYVFMPYQPEFTIIYEYCLKNVISHLNNNSNNDLGEYEFDIKRADESSTGKDAIKKIKDAIEKSDLFIIDITGNNPNVLWELGYCDALEKNSLIISQASEKERPFNISTRDIIEYKFSAEGIIDLRDKLYKNISGMLIDIMIHKTSLHKDKFIYGSLCNVQKCLSSIKSNSILKMLATKEIQRLVGRTTDLQVGRFDLRNKKPNQQIIEYFCEYVGQLGGIDSGFDAITYFNFWNTITLQGMSDNYLDKNLQAADSGAKIRRIFIIDKKMHFGGNEKDILFRKILENYYRKTKNYGDKIQSKVLIIQDYEKYFNDYRNFGLLRKGSEKLLFLPEYSESENLHERKMEVTQFYYYDENKLSDPKFQERKHEIDPFEKSFNRLWNEGEPLSPIHFRRIKARIHKG